MKHPLRRLLLVLPLLTLIGFAVSPRAHSADTPAASSPPAAPAKKAAPKKHDLIVLRLAPRLHDDTAWTDADKAAGGAHFARLKAATAEGQVVLAGRPPESADKTMGLVVFTAPDEPAARAFMADDPCIASGMMLGELHPFDLALLRAK